jgi:hypothetical protein
MTSNEKIGKLTITPEEHAKATLEKLGHDEWTNGHWKHAVQYHLLHSIPNKIFQKKILEDYRKRY